MHHPYLGKGEKEYTKNSEGASKPSRPKTQWEKRDGRGKLPAGAREDIVKTLRDETETDPVLLRCLANW